MLYFLIAFVAFLISAHLVKDERQAMVCIVCAFLHFAMFIYTYTMNYLFKTGAVLLIAVAGVAYFFIYSQVLLALIDEYGLMRVTLVLIDLIALSCVIALYL